MFFQATRFPTSTTPICHLQRSQVKRLPDIPVFDSGRLFVPVEQGEDVEDVIQEVRHEIAPLENPAPDDSEEEPEPEKKESKKTKGFLPMYDNPDWKAEHHTRAGPPRKSKNTKGNRKLFQKTIMKEAYKLVSNHKKLKGKSGAKLRLRICNAALNKFKSVYEDPDFESMTHDKDLVQDFADELEAQLDKA